MAEIRIRNTNELITGEENVRDFLNQFEVIYEHWDTSKLPAHLQENFALTDEHKAEILAIFDTEIKELVERRGYRTWDVITLSEATPNIEELLAKFEQIHTHTEDEIRVIAAGAGTFVIKGGDDIGYFDVNLLPGDLISVPENTVHFFTLTDERKVVAIRLFVEENGWIAHPYEDASFQKA
ncbi:1,2-dihydroxy-3-keto-5-methylthiopentene dioxygenase [Paenibacillus shirakamiensis]|uniref:Acireductone dioxygenase n=1 Tax=Paenibacillus shirakamiensis TaxID=1265935 RepID=A0ABS4JDJ1_9BACL|nr:AraC family ligand binding domain-containing protein [Paenibacillus shirakamiensis]MBP1999787.1 1,2-dihydroxy-3-keto-5-methylthiopentene dioxygenase [Paenibacillus shirakamiensis]